VAVLFFFNGRYPALLRDAELKAFDLRMYAQGTRKPSGRVVIAAIDDKSIAQLGRWPWPRTVLARLTAALKSYNAAVVGFDLVFSERDYYDLQRERGADGARMSALRATAVSNDEAFADAIRAQGNTFIGYSLQVGSGDGNQEITPGFVDKIDAPAPLVYDHVRLAERGLLPPVPQAVAYLPNLGVINRAARGAGYFDTPTDADAVFRSEMMVIRLGKLYCEPLILALVSAYTNRAPTTVALADFGVAGVGVGAVKIPVDEQGRMLVNFRGPAHTFPYYSVSDVIAHRVPAAALANKIVLVGASALGVGDRWSTPMGADFPGVEIHANAIDNILQGDFIQRSDTTTGVAIVAAAIMGLTVSAAVAYLSASWSLVAAAAMICGYFVLAQYLLMADGLLVGVLFPIITAFVTYAGLASYRFIREERENRVLRHAINESR